MDHYEMNYRGYFLEVRMRQRMGVGQLLQYAAEVRVTIGPAGATVCSWMPVEGGSAGDFDRVEDALQEGMARGIAYIDALLDE